MSSIRNVQFSQTKSSTQSLKKKASFSIDESVLEFQLHLLTIGKINEEIDEIKLEVFNEFILSYLVEEITH